MIDHVSIRVSDLSKSMPFYEAALGTLGYKKLGNYGGAVGFGKEYEEGHFWLVQEGYITTGMHIAFYAKNEETVRRFYQAALLAGGKDNGEPGTRPEYGESYFGAFVLDPDGNNVEAVTYQELR